jgi:hypothetical protein
MRLEVEDAEGFIQRVQQAGLSIPFLVDVADRQAEQGDGLASHANSYRPDVAGESKTAAEARRLPTA